jgi:hypothetical protein
MPFFKWMGATAIFVCGVFVDGCLAAFHRRRLAQAEEFLALLRLIRLQIDCFSMPVSRILSECDREILLACGTEGVPRDLKALLASVKLYLPEEMCRLLEDFSVRLGGSYREEELRCCDYYLARLIPCCDALRGEQKGRERVASVLPPALSVALILLLI